MMIDCRCRINASAEELTHVKKINGLKELTFMCKFIKLCETGIMCSKH